MPGAGGRLAYPIGYWNGAAAMLGAAAILLAYGGARAPARSLRTLATAAIPLALLGVWLTSSRGGAAAVVIAGAVLVATSPNRSRQLVPIAIGAGGAAILILAADQMHALTSPIVDSAKRADGDRMTGIALAVVGVAAAAAWWADGREPRVRVSRRVGVALGGLALAGVVVAVVAAHPVKKLHEFEAPPPTRAGVPVGAAGVSSNGRWQFWGQAVDAFESAPVGGLGAGGFEEWWGRHATVPLFVRNPHSLPLQEAAELGIPGIALFLTFVGALALAARRRLGEGRAGDGGVLLAVVVAGAVGAAVDWTWEIPAVYGPAVACAALLLASAPSRPLGRDGYWLGLGTVAAAWVAMVAGGLVVLTEVELSQSRDAARRRSDCRGHRSGAGRQDRSAVVGGALHAAGAAGAAAGRPAPGVRLPAPGGAARLRGLAAGPD